MEGKTSASTYFEQVIVACANMKGRKDDDKLQSIKDAPGYDEWLAEASKDKKWKTDDNTLIKFAKQLATALVVSFPPTHIPTILQRQSIAL